MNYDPGDLVAWWKSFAFRFVALYTTVAVAVVLVGLTALYEREKGEVVDKFGLALETIAGTSAPFLDGDLVDAVRANADHDSDAFRTLRTALAIVAEQNHLAQDQIYILRAAGGGAYEFVVMLQATTFIADRYEPPAEVQERYDWVTKEKDAVRTALYTDAHGTFLSGIAPILRRDGSVAGLLQVDYGVDRYLEAVKAERERYLMGLGVMVALFLGFGVWIHRRLGRDVRALLGGTRAIEAEEYDHRVVIGSSDEMAVVADALNRALAGLKERFEMLKFLPRHTAKMIQAASKRGGVDRTHARRVAAAVFESDIRGFTKISERLPPEAIVGMLNEYIRVQAELIEAAGGSIDKYMGDAVLAIFEGENKARRAVEAALAIQSAVQEMNARRAFDVPVHIGIGITVGELVMGNMGSDARMEHTVIGSPVNLAARLCSQASAGEIVVSAIVREELDDAQGLHFSVEEQIPVKGFADPVACFRAQGDGVARPTST